MISYSIGTFFIFIMMLYILDYLILIDYFSIKFFNACISLILTTFFVQIMRKFFMPFVRSNFLNFSNIIINYLVKTISFFFLVSTVVYLDAWQPLVYNDSFINVNVEGITCCVKGPYVTEMLANATSPEEVKVVYLKILKLTLAIWTHTRYPDTTNPQAYMGNDFKSNILNHYIKTEGVLCFNKGKHAIMFEQHNHFHALRSANRELRPLSDITLFKLSENTFLKVKNPNIKISDVSLGGDR